MDSIMGENDEGTPFDSSKIDEGVVDAIKQEMRREFEVEKIRKLTGSYAFVITHYVESSMESYFEAGYMFDDLAEVAYADFEKWTQADFKKN